MPRRVGASNYHNGKPTGGTRKRKKNRGRKKQSQKDKNGH